jgi:DNA-binding transcriptional LysR family regulator
MTPTPEGARLLAGAERVLQELAALDRAAGVAVTAAGELRVGAGDALGRECLPQAIATLRREQPSLEVRIREGTGPRLLDALRDGEIDLALLLHAVDRGVEEGIDRQPLFESPIELLCPAGQAGSSARATPLSRLAGKPLVTLQPGSAFRRHLESAFRANGLSFAPTVEVGNLSLVVRFVAAGLGVAPFPAIALGSADRAKPIERRLLTGIEPLRYERAVRARAPLTAATGRLLELLGGDP